MKSIQIKRSAVHNVIAVCLSIASLFTLQAVQDAFCQVPSKPALKSREGDSTSHWKALYAFGDSFSDTGAGYLDGNGPTAVAYMAANLSIPFTYAGDPRSQGKSLNFAVSGAESGQSEGVRIRPAKSSCGVNEALLNRGMQNQVNDFAGQVKSGALHFDPQATLFFVAGGGNDEALPTKTTIGNLEDEVRVLYGVGARYFLIALQPIKLPGSIGTRLNPAVEKIPAALNASLPGAHIAISWWGLYFDRVFEHPRQYGLENTKDRCAGRSLFGEDPRPCADPDRYFYFHDGHPSTAVHRIVGRELTREAVAAFP